MPRLRGTLLSALPLLLAWLAIVTQGSVHEYTGERFVSRGNAFVVHGGSEGIVASDPNKNETSYIRYALSGSPRSPRWILDVVVAS